jgi:uncharacterized protein (TIGR03435 family)
MMRGVVLGLLLPFAVLAQPAFDVASIRPTRLVSGVEGGNWPKVAVTPAGLTLHNYTLRDCIEWAWSVRSFQIEAPAWIDDERFEIGARAAGPTATDQLRLMLRSLLQERFRLALHRESKDVAVYALVPAKGGVKLREAGDGESGWSKIGPGLRLSFKRATVAQLAEYLSMLVFIDRPVVDGSALTAAYDFTLDLREVADRSGDAPAPSVGTLLQEQLGLRLETRKAPMEILVVDRAERMPL